MYAGSDIESLMACNVTDPEKHNFFLLLFKVNTKSNRSSVKSQNLIALFMSAQYLIQLQFAARKCTWHVSQAYCTTIAHIYMFLDVRENSTNGLKCPSALVCNSCSPPLNIYTLRVVEMWDRKRQHEHLNFYM